jgi:Flp pilus assembly pilin Flp
MSEAIKRLLRDETGQDVIEYALLTAGLGLAGIAAWPAITDTIGVVYRTLDAGTQDLWEAPDPGAT